MALIKKVPLLAGFFCFVTIDDALDNATKNRQENPAAQMCGRGDSNSHARYRRYHLKVVRLPVSPPPHFFKECKCRGFSIFPKAIISIIVSPQFYECSNVLSIFGHSCFYWVSIYTLSGIMIKIHPVSKHGFGYIGYKVYDWHFY